MKKTLILGLISGTILLAGPVHDLMDNRIKGKSYSGSLNDYEAASDGLGIISLQHHTGISEINNELLIQKVLKNVQNKESDILKKENTIESITLGEIGTIEDKELLVNYGYEITEPNWTSCDDGSNSTYNDLKYNGECSGVSGSITNIQTCNDGIAETIGDRIQPNGICRGYRVLNSNTGNQYTIDDIPIPMPDAQTFCQGLNGGWQMPSLNDFQLGRLPATTIGYNWTNSNCQIVSGSHNWICSLVQGTYYVTTGSGDHKVRCFR